MIDMIVSTLWWHLTHCWYGQKGHCMRWTRTGHHNMTQPLRITWWLLVATWYVGRWRHWIWLVFILQMACNTFIDIPQWWDLYLTMFWLFMLQLMEIYIWKACLLGWWSLWQKNRLWEDFRHNGYHGHKYPLSRGNIISNFESKRRWTLAIWQVRF